ncbi:MAG: MBOAT family O-acyltransferase [Planctomycetota bacterium]
MVFTEGRFFVLFAFCLAVYWTLQSNLWRKRLLLACSTLFYGVCGLQFLGLMYVTVVLDFAMGLLIGKATSTSERKRWLVVSIVSNLSVLGFFKYFNFFTDTVLQGLQLVGLEASPRTLNVILPIGISFYTFQSMSYTIDVYRGHLKPVRNFFDFALFVTFFPQLVAGPIVRAVDFVYQLDRKRTAADVHLRFYLTTFLIGFVKKACIADNISRLVDQVYANPDAYAVSAHWTAGTLYAIQIYCDFSGYSDIAIGCAGLLGYQLVENFKFPYLAQNITEFWRRWHISLSTWFRDYLYIPLGSNRGSKARSYLNILIVFTLCGLWHGASWCFLLWGLVHASYLVIHRVWELNVSKDSIPGRVSAFFGPVLLNIALVFGYVFFRAPDVDTALAVHSKLLGIGSSGTQTIDPTWGALILLLLAVHIAHYHGAMDWIGRRLSDVGYGVVYGLCWTITLFFVATGYKAFIYFQF